jgi:Flp pilus assembly protein TadB
MTTLAMLWLPIVLSAVFVFVASSVIHMVLQLHKADYKRLPNEEQALEALRKAGVPPGQYVFPCPVSGQMKDCSSPEMVAKYEQGPVGMAVVRQKGMPGLGKSLGQWFAFCIVVSVFVAYLTGLAARPGEPGMLVFRVAAAAALLGHAFTWVHDSIWKGVSWGTTARFVFDGVVYALVTGGTFAWLWPAAAA